MIEWSKHPEYGEFMREYIPGHHEKEIMAAFQERFGIELSRRQLKNYKSRFKLRSFTNGGQFYKGQPAFNKGKPMSPEMYERIKWTMFKKGHIPHNHMEVGSERLDSTGYIMVKIAEPNKWRLKQRLLWEERTGEKLSNNEVIIFLDGNRTNFDQSNLCKLTRAELVRYNQDHLYCEDREISLAAANIARIKTRGGIFRNGEKDKEK